MPHRSLLAAALFAMIAVIASAHPAMAAFGAFAYDEGAGKFGYSYNEQTQGKADAAALKGCASGGCKVVFRTGPQQCGAIAATENGKIWGGSRRDRREAAELAAMQDCQKRGSAQCKIKASQCNR
ncbi:MAG TPA: DUF4189 domain-containing protein [Stellaceae bacterium]|jgi:hypothetical protein|nr:DUF4189 domain-containing protein [Stellaceae bacterium]